MGRILCFGGVLFLVVALVTSATGNDFFSDEDEPAPSYEVVVREGRQLKLLLFHNETGVVLLNPRWYHNNEPVAEWRCKSNHSELVCPMMSRNDAGRYEMWASTPERYHQRRLMFAATVRVSRNKVEPGVSRSRVEPRVNEPMGLVAEVVETGPPPRVVPNDCFCSGITGRCWMADNLYRSRLTYNLFRAELVDYQPHAADTTASPFQYVAIPSSVWGGNLITAYGGYLRFPVTNECYRKRTKPCVVFVDRQNISIAYFLPPHHDQRQVSVLMHESNWRILSRLVDDTEYEFVDSELQKFTFLSVLSNLRTVFIRGRYRPSEDALLTIDTASAYDEGHGKVNTVEECQCHEGYAGLSCERCERGYVRNYDAVTLNGVCISAYDLWQMYKNGVGDSSL